MQTLKLKRTYMRGDMVRVLQNMLVKLGYYAADVDAIFGPVTKAAVKAFQKKAKIFSDGIVGIKTWEKLYQATGDKPATEHFDFVKEFDRPHRQDLAGVYTPCPVKYYANAQELFFRLEALRAELNRLYAQPGQEIRLPLHSGYRGQKYNKAVGGATASRHLMAEAADGYAKRVGQDGLQEDHVPNCYQIGLACENLFSTGGFGYGSNANVHIDIRSSRTHWWYSFKSWTTWKAGQGDAAVMTETKE